MVAEPGEGTGEEPGDMHLRDSELVGDLALGTVPEEPQDEDATLALGKPGKYPLHGFPRLDVIQRAVHLADAVTDRGTIAPLGLQRRVERRRGVGPVCLEGLEDLVLTDI